MTGKNVKRQLELVASRIRELRDIMDLSSEDIAKELNIPVALYEKYESNVKEIPIGVIYEIANILKIDSTFLLTGDSPKMIDYTVVRKDKGMQIERFPGYSFSSLAINFIGREMDPMIVDLKERDEPAQLVSHPGQEFNYVLKGAITVTVGKKEITLREGDSIYFNAALPHGQKAAEDDARFLTVIKEK